MKAHAAATVTMVGSAQRVRGAAGAVTYLQLSRVLAPDSVQEGLLELAQQGRRGAGQDPAGLRARPPQLQAALPPRGLRND